MKEKPILTLNFRPSRAVYEVLAQSMRSDHEIIYHDHDYECIYNAFNDVVDRTKERHYITFESNGNPIGFAAYQRSESFPSSKYVLVSYIWLLPEFRTKRLGSAFLAMLEKEWRKRQVHIVIMYPVLAHERTWLEMCGYSEMDKFADPFSNTSKEMYKLLWSEPKWEECASKKGWELEIYGNFLKLDDVKFADARMTFWCDLEDYATIHKDGVPVKSDKLENLLDGFWCWTNFVIPTQSLIRKLDMELSIEK